VGPRGKGRREGRGKRGMEGGEAICLEGVPECPNSELVSLFEVGGHKLRHEVPTLLTA